MIVWNKKKTFSDVCYVVWDFQFTFHLKNAIVLLKNFSLLFHFLLYAWLDCQIHCPKLLNITHFISLGWLTTLIQMNSFGKLVRSKRFMAPDGRFCTSRDEAIKYMVKEGIYEQEEIAIMEEGWRNNYFELKSNCASRKIKYCHLKIIYF